MTDTHTMVYEFSELDADARNALDDADFAYIDAAGGRHLPVNDADHTRAAMARFNQTAFGSDSDKAAAHAKILKAAEKFGIAVESFDEPDSEDVHLDAAGSPKKRSRIKSMVKRIRDAAMKASDPLIPLSTLDDVVDAILGPDDNDEEGEETEQPAMVAYAERSPHVTAQGEEFRFFLPVSCAEAPEWINYLPRPGTFNHPRYGTIAVTPERNRDFVDKFNSGVYQSQVPLDGEHQTKLTGAMGWIKKLRQNADGSADAHVDWTDRGRSMIANNRYRYVSPEWFDEWTEPSTGKTITNVAVGGALVTRPFFKESHLRPLVASEAGILVPDEDEFPTQETQHMTDPLTEPTDRTTKTMTEEDIRRFHEMETELKQAGERITAAEEQAKQATERAAAIEAEARHRSFAEQASPWFGETEDHVSFMESLSDEGRAFYAKQQDAVTEQLKAGNLFSSFGVAGTEGSGSAGSQLQGKIAKLMESEKLDYAAAATKVAGEDPEAYAAYQAETRIHA